MGRAKEYALQEQEHGYYSMGNKFVCPECVGDSDFGDYISENGIDSSCSYCFSNEASVIHFNKFIEHFLLCVYQEYADPHEVGVPWDKGWVGGVFDTYELLDELYIPLNDELRSDILGSLSDRQWCDRDFYNLSPSSALQAGWKEFVNTVKFKSRYVFYRIDDEEKDYRGFGEIPPSYFLDALSITLNELELGKSIKAGTVLFRVRLHDKDSHYELAKDLGSPPSEFAVYPNRMSPSGISMFYGAFDLKTAITETYTQPSDKVIATVATFKSTKELYLIDFSELPPPESIFSNASRTYRHGLNFLYAFLKDFTAPILKDGREHIDYVPTQIVSEHIRYIHRAGNKSIDGIIYPSSKNIGSNAVVLFCENKNCSDSEVVDKESILELNSVTRVNPSDYV